MSERTPVLLIFLRHAGCTFCREAMADLARQRKRIEEAGIRPVLAHMSTREEFRAFAARYGLEQVDQISDPEQSLYRNFGLNRGSLRQLFGWEVIKRVVAAGIADGHGMGRVRGDAAQMPGIFLLWRGMLLRSHRHAVASDRPNFFLFCALPLTDSSSPPLPQ